MNKREHAELFRKRCGLVAATVVDQNPDVHNVGQLADSLLQGSLGVVGRHHNRNTLSVDQGLFS